MNRRYANVQERLLANSVRADLVLPEQDWAEFLYDGTFCWLWVGALKPANTLTYGSFSWRENGKVRSEDRVNPTLRFNVAGAG